MCVESLAVAFPCYLMLALPSPLGCCAYLAPSLVSRLITLVPVELVEKPLSLAKPV